MRCHSVGLWYGEPSAISNAVDYAKFVSRSHDAVIRIYDEAGNVIQTPRARGRFQRAVKPCFIPPCGFAAASHIKNGIML